MRLVYIALHLKVTKTRKAAVFLRFLFILLPLHHLHHQEFHVLLDSGSNEVTNHVPEIFKILSEAKCHFCKQNITSVSKIVCSAVLYWCKRGTNK